MVIEDFLPKNHKNWIQDFSCRNDYVEWDNKLQIMALNTVSDEKLNICKWW